MIVDAHLHVCPPNLPGVGPLSPLLAEPADAVARELSAQMRAADVAVALGMGGWDAGDDDPLGIAATLRVADLVPGLKAIGVADPVRGEDPDHLRRVDAALTAHAGRVAALKCYLGYLHFEPAHPNYRRYYELAERHKLPVVFHTGDTYSPQGKLVFAHPLGVDEVAVDHPNVRFVIAHVGNPWLRDAAEVVYKNLNVWADLSGLVVGDATVFADPEYADVLADLTAEVRRAFRYAERPNRFVFGTDWPLIPLPAYCRFVEGLIPARHHDQVFAENARLLFRL